MTTTHKRRSDRLNLTVPIAVEGLDARGRPFRDDAQALVINRFGGRIRLGRRLKRGQQVLVAGPHARWPAVFEVVETAAPPSGERAEYGVACLDRAEGFWGIRVWGETETPADAKALLDCQLCHTVGFVPLSISQVEALRGVGFVGLPCARCNATTPWSYWELNVPIRAESGEDKTTVALRIEKFTPRRHRRVYVQLPLKVSSDKGAEEITRTENVSRGGLAFSSCYSYQPSEQVAVRFPYDPSHEIPGTRVRIVHGQPGEGNGNVIYGLAFDRRK